MLTAHGVTHTGHVRKTNEDTLLIDLDLGLFLVADAKAGFSSFHLFPSLWLESASKQFINLEKWCPRIGYAVATFFYYLIPMNCPS